MSTGTDDLPGDPCWWPATVVAAEIAAGRLSAREFLAAQRRRIDLVNPAINAIVTFAEDAEEAARAADEAVAHGAVLGPLHGVAVTVKDSLCTRGLRTTGGTPDFADHVPDEDAQVVAALRAAGAVVIGKTNLPEYAADVQTDGPLFGPARNPWDLRFTPGGSSGGAAAAVAAGLSPVELGSDVAGSIRIPAGHCGIFGHRPSFGTVPMHGHIPYPRKWTAPDMAIIGPMARTPGDLELMLGLIAGPGPLDRPAWQLRLPPPRPVRRVAMWIDDPYCPVDDEVRQALSAAAAALAADGVVVDVGSAAELGLDVRLAESDEIFQRMVTGAASSGYPLELLEDIAAGRRGERAELGGRFIAQRHREWMAANERRAQLRLRWGAFFERYDAVLLPVAPNPVPLLASGPVAERRIEVNGHRRPYWDQIVWAGLSGVAYLPTTVAPVGLDRRGLPIGVCVTGAYLEDRTTMALAGRLAGLLPTPPRPPLPQLSSPSPPRG